MSDKRHEEILDLHAKLVAARKTGDAERDPFAHKDHINRLVELLDGQWQDIQQRIPELHPYRSVTEGIYTVAQQKGIVLPEQDTRQTEIPEMGRGGFYHRFPDRSVQILPNLDRENPPPFPEVYIVRLLTSDAEYGGRAPNLEELARIISGWLVDRRSYDELLEQHSWLIFRMERATQ